MRPLSDVLDTGLWTLGVVTALAVPYYLGATEEPKAAVFGAVLVFSAVFTLGVTGERAVDAVARLADPGEPDGDGVETDGGTVGAADEEVRRAVEEVDP